MTEFFLDNLTSQLVVHEWISHILQCNVAFATLGVGTILAISGPFGTADSLLLLERSVYWLFLSLSSYAVGNYANIASFTFLKGTLLKKWALTTSIASVIICGIIVYKNAVFLTFGLKILILFFLIFFQICVITGVINGLMLTTHKQRFERDDQKGVTLLGRLPYDLRMS